MQWCVVAVGDPAAYGGDDGVALVSNHHITSPSLFNCVGDCVTGTDGVWGERCEVDGTGRRSMRTMGQKGETRLARGLECLRTVVLAIPPGIVWVLLIWSYYVFNYLYVLNYVVSPFSQVSCIDSPWPC